jgi:predicted DCC family thiol-disulfide oxidoreductase YuxK
MEMSKNTRTENNDIHGSVARITPSPAIVRYDAACSLCTTLAEFMGKRVSTAEVVFLPSEKTAPEKLEIEFPGRDDLSILSGENAWKWLLENHPALNEINWIAQKLGISAATSRHLMRSAEILRRFCFRCR